MRQLLFEQQQAIVQLLIAILVDGDRQLARHVHGPEFFRRQQVFLDIAELARPLRAERLSNYYVLDDGDDQVVQVPDPADGPESILERYQRAEMTGRAVSLLASLQHQAIELAFFHDLSYPEVAREMMIPLGTAKTWIRRSCIELRTTCSDSHVLQRRILNSQGALHA